MSERDQFLQSVIEIRHARLPNDLVDIHVARHRCPIDDLANSKIVMDWQLKASW
jgi:hypothetical protein